MVRVPPTRALLSPMEPFGWGCRMEPELDCRPEPAHFLHSGHSQHMQDLMLYRRIFCDKCNKVPRTYVELGALNGKTYSNTLLLESVFGWGGLLIEGQPTNAEQLNRTRGQSGRNFIMPEAVCKEPGLVKFLGHAGAGTAGVADYMSDLYKKQWHSRLTMTTMVPCRPIGHMLKLAGVREVDLFSLDVEGGELDVLHTMDWDVRVKLWMIEAPTFQPGELDKPREIRRLLARKGYVEVTSALRAGPRQRLGEYNWSAPDMLFVHQDLHPTFPERMERCLNMQPCSLADYAQKLARAAPLFRDATASDKTTKPVEGDQT